MADDREQILASFEDGEGAHLHGGGDGASGSSVGTGSPDIFHVSNLRHLFFFLELDGLFSRTVNISTARTIPAPTSK